MAKPRIATKATAPDIEPAARAALPDGDRYLDTANLGLVPPAAAEEIGTAAKSMSAGTWDSTDLDRALRRARVAMAQVMQTEVEAVSVGTNVSSFVGLFAASLPAGSRILAPEHEFSSLVRPFTTQRHQHDVLVVPPHELINVIDRQVDVVAVSAAQSIDGSVLDLDALADACATSGTRVVLDATQAAGWLPIEAGRFDLVVTAAYKWLLCPRGVAFAAWSADLLASVPPINAGWYAAREITSGMYGIDTELASDARRFDTAPAALPWLAAPYGLELICNLGIDAIYEHNTMLTQALHETLGLPAPRSAMTAIPVTHRTAQVIRDAGIRCGIQPTSKGAIAHFAFHVYNTMNDVEAVTACFR